VNIIAYRELVLILYKMCERENFVATTVDRSVRVLGRLQSNRIQYQNLPGWKHVRKPIQKGQPSPATLNIGSPGFLRHDHSDGG